MARRQKTTRRHKPKTILRFPDLEQSKNAVVNSLAAASSQESYGHAIDEFIGWYCSEPRLAFNRTVVLRYRFFLEQKNLVRRRSMFGSPPFGGWPMGSEVRDSSAQCRSLDHMPNGFGRDVAPPAQLWRRSQAAGITTGSIFRAVSRNGAIYDPVLFPLGTRIGNWLRADQCRSLLCAPVSSRRIWTSSYCSPTSSARLRPHPLRTARIARSRFPLGSPKRTSGPRLASAIPHTAINSRDCHAFTVAIFSQFGAVLHSIGTQKRWTG